jgi:hypothetical protein
MNFHHPSGASAVGHINFHYPSGASAKRQIKSYNGNNLTLKSDLAFNVREKFFPETTVWILYERGLLYHDVPF